MGGEVIRAGPLMAATDESGGSSNADAKRQPIRPPDAARRGAFHSPAAGSPSPTPPTQLGDQAEAQPLLTRSEAAHGPVAAIIRPRRYLRRCSFDTGV